MVVSLGKEGDGQSWLEVTSPVRLSAGLAGVRLGHEAPSRSREGRMMMPVMVRPARHDGGAITQDGCGVISTNWVDSL